MLKYYYFRMLWLALVFAAAAAGSAAVECPPFVARFPYSPCSNRQPGASCALRCDPSAASTTGVDFNSTCLSHGSWSEVGDCSHLVCSSLCTCALQSATPHMDCKLAPGAKHVPIGLPQNLVFLSVGFRGVQTQPLALEPLINHSGLVELRLSLAEIQHVAYLESLPHLVLLSFSYCTFNQFPFPFRGPQLRELAFRGIYSPLHKEFDNSAAAVPLDLALFSSPSLRKLILPPAVRVGPLTASRADPMVQQLEVLGLTMASCQTLNLSAFAGLRSVAIACGDTAPLRLREGFLPSHQQLMQFRLFHVNSIAIDLDAFYGAINWTAHANGDVERRFRFADDDDYVPFEVQIVGQRTLALLEAQLQDYHLLCNCTSPPFVGAPYCPAPFSLPCQGSAARINATSLCNGMPDCPGGEDERFCAGTLQLVAQSFPRSSLADCVRVLHISLRAGLLTFPRAVLSESTFDCARGYGLMQAHHAAAGNLGASTFR
jgi:hypothetical protein